MTGRHRKREYEPGEVVGHCSECSGQIQLLNGIPVTTHGHLCPIYLKPRSRAALNRKFRR